ncbi:CPBP family intramembrane metalloprotease [Dyadobacter sp. CY345]|uniref:CPBP family intramembrane glutamic endopeptidase n=1 Tax=Dyadobacter sp. CY345 TaxID=2909335 RepID=UPI001F3425E7|nr:CPBP family intramembrane glutamic endopeptidase [Dyadobacter sp. CY345]MCF2446275.1 CPBP family intramembrane metalloprotease [Dyadobacter sp. CY345]
MRFKDLARIILTCCLYANTIGLIFITEWVQKVFINWQQAILLGLVIIVMECLLFARLLKPFSATFSYGKLFAARKLLSAILMAFTVWILLQLWTHHTFGTEIEFPDRSKVIKYGLVFLFNSFPNALIEEFIFRFLPARYAENKGLSRQQLIGLGIIVSIIFSLSHVSVYLLRDHTEWSNLTANLLSVFFYGMVYFFIYILTGNIFFTALIHAFGNNQLLLINTPGFEAFYFYTFIFVTLVWYAGATFSKHYR